MSNNSSGQFPLPGVAIIVIALGVFIFTDNPFQPTRPKAPNNLTAKAEDVVARLWQDPFEAVELHRNDKHKIESPQLLLSNNNSNGENVRYLDANHTVCNFDSENYNSKLVVKDSNPVSHAKIGTKNGKINELNEVKKPKKNVAHVIDELRCQIQRDIDIDTNQLIKFDLHILAVMVTGGAYAENREGRIRSRYAVISGLSSVGYVPIDSEHIGYMDFSALCAAAIKNDGGTVLLESCDWPASIPYEWFKSEDLSTLWLDYGYAKNILVLWLNDEVISTVKPLDLLVRLKDELTLGAHERHIVLKDENNKFYSKNDVRVKFDVVGPASSTSLIKMYDNFSNKCQNGDSKCINVIEHYGDKKIRIFSPRATIDDDAIKRIFKNRNIDSNLKIPGFRRTIATDSKLVDNLLCELLRRGINPYGDIKLPKSDNSCSNYSSSKLNKFGKKDYIVLIGEWDTVYSRNFNYLFRQKIKYKVNKYKKYHNEKEIGKVNWLYNFNYFRGLDGEIGNSKVSSNESNNKDKKLKTEKSLRRPVGANQFDYLRRLATQISELSKSKNDVGSIKAIGIVGSDTYDKLLILQALRNRFPGLLFFTTDLDARMLHKDENLWARNLVVASANGLTPNKSKRYTFKGLAFRDSYQTTLYDTIQKVTEKEDSKLPISPVKIFEIGNNSLVDYSHTGESENSNNESINFRYILLSIGLLMLLILQTSNKTRLYIFLVAVTVGIVSLWVNLINASNSAEFQAMFTGTSVWPAYIIRMTAAVMAIIFIFYIIISLKKNTSYIIQQNELSDKECKSFVDEIRDNTKESTNKVLGSCLLIFPYAVKWLFKYDCYDKKTIKKRKLTKPKLISCFFITSWNWVEKRYDKARIDNLFYQYMEISKTRWWLIRVIFISILYFIIAIIFLKSFPSNTLTFYVGEVSANAQRIILLSVLIPYIFLIFFVSDITRLNLRFIELLSKYKMIWPDSVLNECCKKYGLNKEIAVEKLKLDLIVVRSKVIDELIFLPFVILTLIILSRSSYFERWHMPPQLALVIILGACIALSSAIRLRRAARKARRFTLNNLNDIYNQELHKEANPQEGVEVQYKKIPERLKNIITEIENFSTGPFSPITKHPIVAAVAMPFGGIGGLYLIDYMSTMGM